MYVCRYVCEDTGSIVPLWKLLNIYENLIVSFSCVIKDYFIRCSCDSEPV